MFYSVFVLGKKGPLARVWLAAHWDKKITKAQILETNIVESVDSILQPKVKLSLRTSSHLLLGIVRIYARKTLYLLQDCQDAAFKIKSAFRPGVVDLPDGKTEAAISAITLPEMFDFINDFDLMSEPQLHLEPTTTANIRNITLAEDISSIHVDDPLLMNEVRDWSDIGSIGGGSINIKDGSDPTLLNDSGISLKNNMDIYDRPALDDGFGGQLGVGIVDEDDVFGMTMPSQEEVNAAAGGEGSQANLENGHGGDGSNLDNPISSRPNSAMSPAMSMSDNMSFNDGASLGSPGSPGSPNMLDDVDPFNAAIGHNGHNNNMDNESMITDDSHTNRPAENMPGENGQISANTMVLEPIDSQLGGLLERKRKRRKKIGMVIDEVKTLSGEEMKAQLSDTTDIVTNLDLAPPNKMLMNWKKTGLSDKLFTLPERNISTKVLVIYYTRNLITSRYGSMNENELNDEEALLLNHDVPDEDQEMALFNGHHPNATLPELDDVEAHLANLPPHEFAAPKTPIRAPKSPAPARKNKRKTAEDKENKVEMVYKRPRGDSRHEKSIQEAARAEHGNESSLQHIQNNNTFETSSIHDASAPYNHEAPSFNHDASYGDAPSIQGQRNNTLPGGQDSLANFSAQPNLVDSDEDKEEEDHDDDDDFFNYDGNGPMSVGPGEEMLPDETADQFEERIRNKRSNILLKHMGSQLDEVGHIYFSNLIRNNKRKLVSQKFYALLVLKKQMAVELYQDIDHPYSELTVTKGLKYDEHMVSSA